MVLTDKYIYIYIYLQCCILYICFWGVSEAWGHPPLTCYLSGRVSTPPTSNGIFRAAIYNMLQHLKEVIQPRNEDGVCLLLHFLFTLIQLHMFVASGYHSCDFCWLMLIELRRTAVHIYVIYGCVWRLSYMTREHHDWPMWVWGHPIFRQNQIWYRFLSFVDYDLFISNLG